MFLLSGKEKEAANTMKITAEDLMELGVADKIISEPLGGAHNDINMICDNIVEYLFEALKKNCTKSLENLLESRYNKFRKIGLFSE